MPRKNDRTGERFGRYKILGELGRGAMGIVYKARDPKINRVVAVKTFSLAGQPVEEEREYRQQFFREAEAAGRLSHPGIVTVFDVGEEPETHTPYIVMEFVSGKSLDKLLLPGDHKLPLDAALQLAHELAEALDCAHSQGVVHRDLKPANILITEEGRAKIADFGIAKLNLANQTLTGRALGTPAYMSPEQLNGEEVDGRSDLFSLGVVLYTVLTGHRPFQGNSAMTVSFKVVNREPVPATVFETELPPGLDHILARAMAKDPAQRYQRGAEMASDLQALRKGLELPSQSQEGALAGGSAQSSNDGARASATGQSMASLLATAQAARDHSAERFLGKMRNRPFAAAVLALGLLVFALRVGPLILRKHTTNWSEGAGRNAAEAAPADDFAVLTRVPVLTAPAVTAPSAPPSVPAVENGRRARQAAPSKPAPGPALLAIEVEYKFEAAHLSIWVDGRLSFTHLLEGTDKTHLVVFHHVEGREFHAMEVPPGNHELRVEVTSDSLEKSALVSGDFASGNEKMLRVLFDKQGAMNLRLE